MTRINVVPVEELTDNFILAEYFELPRLFPLIEKAADRTENQDKTIKALPLTYRLGEGHMRFFYDKLSYLYDRHKQLLKEGTKRGLTLQVDPNVPQRYLDQMLNVSRVWYHDYTPTPEAIQLNWDRLQVRRRYEGGSYPSK